MGSLYYSSNGTARFRVWAPFAAQIDVILGHPVANTTFALANESGTPNWSADGIPAPPNTRYQYRITNAAGQDNDTSQPHIRTDARALQVEGSDAACQGYIVDPGLFNANRTPLPRPPLKTSSFTSSTSAPSPAATMASQIHIPPRPSLTSRIACHTSASLASMPSSSCPSRTSRPTPRAEPARATGPRTCSRPKICTPPPPTRQSPNSSS
jgi:hypothetical protein